MKKQLEMRLQRLMPVDFRSPQLEQYSTPAAIAADILWMAYEAGDIQGKAVADLGCGNGVFCIGAILLGAARAVGVDIDERAVKIAYQNAKDMALNIDFASIDISEFHGSFDTTVQNPPFGAQRRHADRAFVEKAIEISQVTYSLHNEVSIDFMAKMAKSMHVTCVPVKRYKFEIPYAFEFHRKTKEVVSVVLLKFQK
jgi:putative methylase